MAFKASTERGRKKKVAGEGKQLFINAGVEAWYRKELDREILAMTQDYREAIRGCFENRSVRAFYTEDAAAANVFQGAMTRLRKKWAKRFEDLAKRLAPAFVQKGETYSAFTTKHVLKGLGVMDPNNPKSVDLHNALQASVAENVALITNIQQDFAKGIEGDVYRSIASNNPTENGSSKVMENLLKKEGITKRRAEVIARDQNAKLYTNLNKLRMEANGVKLFRWKHSSAGKTQRHTHLERQRQDVGYGPGIFRFDSPELWEGPQSDWGLPGEAINCRCRMQPIIDPSLLY